MITIHTNGMITKDSSDTGYSVFQKEEKTVVLHRPTQESVEMPSQRYALSHDKPASGSAGRAQFIADFEAMLNAKS